MSLLFKKIGMYKDMSKYISILMLEEAKVKFHILEDILAIGLLAIFAKSPDIIWS